eukprot:Rhum_TRINITY_DN14813_c4_g3::Rhum_TRINITY_DN14813_c4_g3_i1::g.120472::m.120472
MYLLLFGSTLSPPHLLHPYIGFLTQVASVSTGARAVVRGGRGVVAPVPRVPLLPLSLLLRQAHLVRPATRRLVLAQRVVALRRRLRRVHHVGRVAALRGRRRRGVRAAHGRGTLRLGVVGRGLLRLRLRLLVRGRRVGRLRLRSLQLAGGRLRLRVGGGRLARELLGARLGVAGLLVSGAGSLLLLARQARLPLALGVELGLLPGALLGGPLLVVHVLQLRLPLRLVLDGRLRVAGREAVLVQVAHPEEDRVDDARGLDGEVHPLVVGDVLRAVLVRQVEEVAGRAGGELHVAALEGTLQVVVEQVALVRAVHLEEHRAQLLRQRRRHAGVGGNAGAARGAERVGDGGDGLLAVGD